VSEHDERPQRGPLWAVIAAFFVPFLAVLFPYLVLDDYRRTRELAAAGTTTARPERAARKRDGMFYAAGALWLGTLLAIPVTRSSGMLSVAAALITAHIVSASFSAALLVIGWARRDKRTPEEKQAEFAVREAQVVAFFRQRDEERSQAAVGFSEPAVPWIGRGVWRRWFLVRWDAEEYRDGFPDDAPLDLPRTQRAAGEHATPVTQAELDGAPTAEIVGDWAPRRAEDWTTAAKPDEKPLPELEADVTSGTPSPFAFPGMAWPVCHGRLAVMIWEGNVGLPPDGIGLPMGLPQTIEQLIVQGQGFPPWDLPRGWDGNAVFQCSDCGRLYWRPFED